MGQLREREIAGELELALGNPHGLAPAEEAGGGGPHVCPLDLGREEVQVDGGPAAEVVCVCLVVHAVGQIKGLEGGHDGGEPERLELLGGRVALQELRLVLWAEIKVEGALVKIHLKGLVGVGVPAALDLADGLLLIAEGGEAEHLGQFHFQPCPGGGLIGVLGGVDGGAPGGDAAELVKPVLVPGMEMAEARGQDLIQLVGPIGRAVADGVCLGAAALGGFDAVGEVGVLVGLWHAAWGVAEAVCLDGLDAARGDEGKEHVPIDDAAGLGHAECAEEPVAGGDIKVLGLCPLPHAGLYRLIQGGELGGGGGGARLYAVAAGLEADVGHPIQVFPDHPACDGEVAHQVAGGHRELFALDLCEDAVLTLDGGGGRLALAFVLNGIVRPEARVVLPGGGVLYGGGAAAGGGGLVCHLPLDLDA